MDKIQLVTQPEKDSASEASQERTLQKLKALVSDYLPDANDEEGEETNKKNKEKNTEKVTEGKGNNINDLREGQGEQSSDKDANGNVNDDKEGSGQTQEKKDNEEEDDVEYDDDGFEIPQGKIPLDGHFSTREIKELVKLSKKEGILKDDVNIKVLESNEAIGDKVVISEEHDKNEKNEDEDGSKIEKKGKENNEDVKKYSDQSDHNSVDPKDKAKQYRNKAGSG